ncbi:hypothetical protein KBC89_00550 [Candidatus Woesebacteria bacterium]|nr:hypothetical protein [Candidatus Woesebacteria bacterium]
MRKNTRLFRYLLVGFVAIFGYLAIHLIKLDALPVFADEAIYIRWAQLILDDARQYWIFPMNDGKTPLFIWTMVPLLKLVENQLLAGRYISILVGLFQAIVLGLISWRMTKDKFSAGWVMLLTSTLPFWFFYQRMALMDSLLTFWLSVAVLLVLVMSEKAELFQKKLQTSLPYIASLGLVLFLAIWTKLPAVLFLLALIPTSLIIKQKQSRHYLTILGLTLTGVSLSLVFFVATSVLPAFSQLFSRGGDFLYSIPDFLKGGWKVLFFNSGLSTQSLVYYLSPLVVLSPIIGLFFSKHRRKQLLLLLAASAFMLPMILLAKVYYPRYLLPVSIFFTLSSGLIVDAALTKITVVNLKKRAVIALGLALYCANILAFAGQWNVQAIIDSNAVPMVAVDRMQYLEEWSSGHGIAETVDLLQSIDKSQRIAVATEGYFGTLPDALLLYLHNQDVSNLSIDGIGQPVWDIPQWFIEKTISADERWLVVNSHRMRMTLPEDQLIAEFCRPNSAPCLQIWNITEYSKTLENK